MRILMKEEAKKADVELIYQGGLFLAIINQKEKEVEERRQFKKEGKAIEKALR
jgi:hypothetical protein